MLKNTKIKLTRQKVEECGTNTKKLYSLINNITGSTKDNPMPSTASTTNEELANEFANFFMDKIQKIRDELDVHPTYQPTSVNICQLNNFVEMSEEEVRKSYQLYGNKKL